VASSGAAVSPARRRAGVRATAALLGGAAVLAAAPAASAGATAARASKLKPRTVHVPGWAPTADRAHVARLVAPTRARRGPGSRRLRLRLGTEDPWTGGPVQLLVLDAVRIRRTGTLWLKVRLPARPNDAAGWIDADHALVRTTGWRLVIRRRARTVSVYRGGRRVRRFRAVVGKPATPTPLGLFAIWEEARQPDPGAFLGPWALHLTAHSNVLTNYGGGPGRVAIHGRSGASLLDPLGTARSHGCVRVDNRQIRWLARKLIPGTPVAVRR
jgi:lipoprotein-anchoring transpeptidase ErfK/SrfK